MRLYILVFALLVSVLMLLVSSLQITKRLNYYSRLVRGQSLEIKEYDKLRKQKPRIVIKEREKIVEVPFKPSDERYYKSWGFNFKPALAVGVHSHLDFGIDFNVFFIKKWGLNVGTTTSGPSISISYSLRDLPLIDNSELFIGQMWRFDDLNTRRIYAGTRISL